MGCDLEWEDKGEKQSCQFDEETDFFPCDGRSYCRFHLPLEDEEGRPTEKEKWREGKELTSFNEAIFDIIRAAKRQNTHAGLRHVYHPGAIAFRGLSEELNGFPIVDFRTAVFSAKADFNSVTFNYKTLFESARFQSDVDFQNSKFNRDADFSSIKCSGDAKFTAAEFKENVWFDYAQFYQDLSFSFSHIAGNADFRRVQFHRNVAFPLVAFGKNVTFLKSRFTQNADFNSASCSASIDFEGAWFGQVPDYRCTKFDNHVTLHRMDISDELPLREKIFGCSFRKARNGDEADQLRRLKELAILARDHDREQNFFTMELKAKRFYETKGLALVGSYLYQWLSDFGRSIKRPFLMLCLTWIFVGVYFAPCPAFGPCVKIGEGLAKSASFLFPFLGASQKALKDGLHGFDAFLGFTEGGLGLVFLFLIGLALRNRFRI